MFALRPLSHPMHIYIKNSILPISHKHMNNTTHGNEILINLLIDT